MAIFQATRKYLVIFLALVAFNGSLLAHGRQIKPLNKDTHVVVENNPFHPLTHSVDVPTPSSEKKIFGSSAMPKQGVETFGDSGGDTNAFRPTTPGNSPGVGHRKFAQQDKDTETKVAVQSPDVKVYVTEGTTNGLQGTNPGHSPGVGHGKLAQEDKDMKAKVAINIPDVKVYVTEGTTNDFKPTDPGHSP
ncbi:Precursor of CEP9, partial [Mucuna pruriens]